MELQSIDYKDWFINQKALPDKASSEYKAFYDFHKELCLNGVMMGGVYINPFLYWHLNTNNYSDFIITGKINCVLTGSPLFVAGLTLGKLTNRDFKILSILMVS